MRMLTEKEAKQISGGGLYQDWLNSNMFITFDEYKRWRGALQQR